MFCNKTLVCVTGVLGLLILVLLSVLFQFGVFVRMYSSIGGCIYKYIVQAIFSEIYPGYHIGLSVLKDVVFLVTDILG